MRKLILNTFIFILLANCTVAAINDRKLDLIDELMILSGVTRQLEVIPSDISDLFSEIAFIQKGEGMDISSENIEEYSGILKQVCREDLIKQDMRFYLKNNLSEMEIKEVIEWLNNPLVRRFTELEVESVNDNSDVERRIYFEKLQDQKPSEYRVQMCLYLDDQYGATTGNVLLYKDILNTLYEVVEYKLPRDQRSSLVSRKIKAENRSEEMREVIANNTIFNILFMYRSVSNIDLLRYLKTCESESISRYFKVISSAYNDSVNKSLYRFLDRLRFSKVHI